MEQRSAGAVGLKIRIIEAGALERENYTDHFVPNLILYKTVRIKIRDYFALLTSFKLKKPPYRNVGLR